ncbi:putative fatty acyl-CoA reductase CG5065 [Copidosoma floridanum]|uniref:putative fatty acyl-CoA reductase CG5065 n=1 Tax=Copidosoma floridanum TaxID=29053 RepID=UPI0006C98C43|nr:putative fatty acyl-CoA reductase CG5065 [Copidosoma floridanum]XP_014212140.1 putative fatty acyl-CoA reductase CG5065 [Copidosoma floridanum]
MADEVEKKPSIPDWYRDRAILVTGATGFMGKLLVAKLLISCHDVKTIYLLVRDKKGVPSKSRLPTLVQQEPFRLLRDNHPERLKKLVVISGDTTCDELGISAADAEILKNNVSVLFNMAANVRFDLPLKSAVTLNTKGTANVIAFAKQIKNLDAFIHVSTAFCHCNQTVLEEKFYPVERSPEKMIKLVEETPEDLLEAMTPKVLRDQPNTYAFTKALSEDLVRRCGLPTGLARPSIVVGSWKEPDNGWVDNMNGPTGIMIGAGKGVIRTMLCNGDYNVDLIPCDMAVHAIIGLGWKVGRERPVEPLVVNLTESRENPITWRYALDVGKKHALANPFSGPLWYPGGGLTSSKVYHALAVFFLHTLPAYFLDALIMLTGHKPFLVKVQARVTYGLNLVNYYTTKQWIFKNERLKELRESLSPSDKETFFMDIREVSWNDFLLKYILAARKYCLKDDPSTLPQARRVFAYLYFCDLVVKAVFLLFCGWFLYSWMIPPRMTIGAALDVAL